MKNIIILLVLTFGSNLIWSQTYNMKINQGTGATYSATNTVDEITFLNTATTPFVCGDVILYGGDTYHTVIIGYSQIGTQCWLQENLNVGTRISGVTEQTNNSTIEKYCYSDFDANCTTYGGLYQWAEAVQYLNGATNTASPSPAFSGNVQGICPSGWHIPTKAEFETLAATVAGVYNSNALKAKGQGTGSGAGTNLSYFSALLAGDRDNVGSFGGLGSGAYFWSSTEYTAPNAYYLGLWYNDSNINFYDGSKAAYGFSVRCVKD